MTAPSNGSVTVKDIVLRLEGKVDALIETAAIYGNESKNQAIQAADHENRLRDLERWRYAIPASVFTALGASAAAIAAAIFTQ